MFNIKRKGSGTKAASKRPVFKSDNRKVDWDKPTVVDGIEYYPIKGARAVKHGNTTYKEYATGNGNIVIIGKEGNRRNRPVMRFINHDEQELMREFHPEISDGFSLEFGPPGSAREGLHGYRDRRRSYGGNNVWVNDAQYRLVDGAWTRTSLERYILTERELERRILNRKDGAIYMNGPSEYGRFMEVSGDRATCMDFLYPADEYQIDDFSKKVPCPPKSVPPTTPKRSSNTKSSRDAIGRELDRLAKGDPGYATAAKDPEVRKWVRDYYGYLEDTFHGNQGSPGEIVGGGFIIDFIAGSEGADTEERIRDVLDVDYGGEGAEIYSRLDTLRPKVGRMLGSANRKPKASRPKTATKSLPSTKRSTKPKTATRRGKR